MNLFHTDGVTIAGVHACLPATAVDNLENCAELFGSRDRAAAVVGATGIRTRRVAPPGVSSLDLCVAAAERLLAATGTARSEIRGVVAVTFTPERSMPCNACAAQARLALPSGIPAFDVAMACSGYVYGLHLAGSLARAAGGPVLLLDGDVQSARLAAGDEATVPVLADAGTATLVRPSAAPGAGWTCAFLTDGAGGDALRLPVGGTIAMDGFAVFKFVAGPVAKFLKEFLAVLGRAPDSFDAFVPHQANVYMIRQLARALGFGAERLVVSADEFGNSASATVPVTLARTRPDARRLLLAGFGGGLSAAAAAVDLADAPAPALGISDFFK